LISIYISKKASSKFLVDLTKVNSNSVWCTSLLFSTFLAVTLLACLFFNINILFAFILYFTVITIKTTELLKNH
jgi:hypothetical protein